VRIGPEDLEAFAAGARALASGAEESSHRAALDWARATLAEHEPVLLIAPEDLPPNGLCLTISLLGSSAALAEQLPGGEEPLQALRALEQALGHPAQAVIGLNTAAENALVALITAAQAGLPLVDGDGCGRVFPLLEQSTFTLAGVDVAPLGLCTPGGDTLVLRAASTRVEDLVRPLVLAAGGWAVVACYPMRGAQLTAAVPGTVTRALAAGRPGSQLGDGARRLCRGRITEVEHPWVEGTDRAAPSTRTSIVVTETEGLLRRVRLEAHNEILLALADGAEIASVPDQVLMVSPTGGQVVDVERAQPGLEVEVLLIPAAAAWRTPAGRRLAGSLRPDPGIEQEEPW
jgi:DUF917 family protein